MESKIYTETCADCGKTLYTKVHASPNEVLVNMYQPDPNYVCYACVQAYKLKILNEANAVAAIRGNRKERRKIEKRNRKLQKLRGKNGTSTSQIKVREIRKQQDKDLDNSEQEA